MHIIRCILYMVRNNYLVLITLYVQTPERDTQLRSLCAHYYGDYITHAILENVNTPFPRSIAARIGHHNNRKL
jgi:hypothetical protein